jgi:Na+-transporting methylmalonyl-CoA/oxaloacetate decarboxylase gamma subunit
MSLYAQGLTLSLMGMLVTFASLGLFILIIVLLQRMFGAAQPPTAPTHQPQATSNDPPASNVGMDDAQLAAVVAVSIALEGNRPSAGALGAALTQGRGRWWSPSAVNRSSPTPRLGNRRHP